MGSRTVSYIDNWIRHNPTLSAEDEYQVMRGFMKLISSDDPGPVTAAIALALEDELTEKQRDYIGAYYLEQMLMPDIAASRSVAISSVSRGIARGRAKLRKALKYGALRLLAEVD